MDTDFIAASQADCPQITLIDADSIAKTTEYLASVVGF